MVSNIQLLSVFKRIISNLIDISTYLIGYVILSKISRIDISLDASYYLLFINFIITFLIPILTLGNTIGKIIFKLSWENSDKKLILLKYSIYFLLFFPGFSLVSLLTDFPYLKLSDYGIGISIQLTITFITLDIFVFLFSLGKYHLIDYYFNIQLVNLEFKKKELKSLSIYLLFWSVFIFINFNFFKNNLSIDRVDNFASHHVYFENYPEDLFYGEKPYIIKKNSDDVFITSDMLSFLFKKSYEQKIIYLKVPLDVFNLTSNRIKICKELLRESILHDNFLNYKPKQTKIVLHAFKDGEYIEYYNYNYTYYYDNENPKWGIYGGVRNDSTTIKKYINFVKGISKNKPKTIKIQSKIFGNKYVLSSNNFNIQFNKINFEDTKLHGRIEIFFPPQKNSYRTNYWNIIGSDLTEIEDELRYLRFSRNEISSKEL